MCIRDSSGIGTHYVSSTDLPTFMDKLINEADPTDLRDFFEKNCMDTWNKPSSILPHLDDIDAYFACENVVQILKELYRCGGIWEKDVAEMMRLNSPTSLAITKRQLELGQFMDLKDCLKMEYRLSCAALDKKITHDFYEGDFSNIFHGGVKYFSILFIF